METKSNETQRRVKMIIAGAEERLNWPRFFEVQTAAMPHPGPGGNLDGDEDQKRLWRGESGAGENAVKWFERRMRNGVPIEQAVADAQSKEPQALAMVNVEAVNSRWVDNIGKFLDAVDTQVNADFKDDIADDLKAEEREQDAAKNNRWKPKPVTGPGWVVEIRGYTDHKAGPQFIKKALIKNLQKFDNFAKNENKVGQYIVGVQDPIKGRVSHAFVYKVWPSDDAQPNTFVNITQSYLDKLMSSSGGSGGFGGGGKMGGPSAGGPGPSGSGGGPPSGGGEAAPSTALGPNWNGLGSAQASSMGGGGYPGMKGPGPGSSSGGPTPPSSGGPTPPSSMGTGTPPKEGAPKDERRRYEFVIMMVWREPTPSTPEKAP
jgi:uncharacterized membrane protein YgcG